MGMSLSSPMKPTVPRSSGVGSKVGGFGMRAMKHYTFVDYATQIYSALVAGLILLFHNSTVLYWQWLAGAHLVQMAVVHW